MTIRFGILGAARIAPPALIKPVARLPQAQVIAVAARDGGRACRFAREWGIPRVHDTYTELLRDDRIDAVYVALPASEHARWSIAALQAGKHVLVEKPMAANAAEATAMVSAAESAGRLLVEAMHWRYHPVSDELLQVVADNGGLLRTTARFSAPITDRSDIRYQLGLAGGAMMDLGCYPLHWAQTVAGEAGTVVAAEAVTASPGVDIAMQVTLAFPAGTQAGVSCSMEPGISVRRGLQVVTPGGVVEVDNLVSPGPETAIMVSVGAGRRSRRPQDPGGCAGMTTYDHQLRAFVQALEGGPVPLTVGRHAIGRMQLLDQAYAIAGLAGARLASSGRGPSG